MKLSVASTFLALGLLGSSSTVITAVPNVIVMQPDDLSFFDLWTSPPNNPSQPNLRKVFPGNNGVPYMEKLRTDGLQMMQAYASSPQCGTSRYSTITGRLASRAVSNSDASNGRANAIIPQTKLEGEDCSTANMAATFKANGYRTGVTGKWHLSGTSSLVGTYANQMTKIKDCGFDYADGIFVENINSVATYHHNQEWVTEHAMNFITQSVNDGENFFLYFNPTAPHSPSVDDALNYACTATPNGTQPEPQVLGMTIDETTGASISCADYRNTIRTRANLSTRPVTDHDLGAIWVDDMIKALFLTLDGLNVLDDTIIVFQLDHGMETKSALYENGVRIPQFIHYPAGNLGGKQFYGPVSTIDLAPTLFDFAGITSAYNLDGVSWKDIVYEADANQVDLWIGKRCILTEDEFDRAVICGNCEKLFSAGNAGTSGTLSTGNNRGLATDADMYFGLCSSATSGDYEITGTSPEGTNLYNDPLYSTKVNDIEEVLQCFLDKTNANNMEPDYHTVCSLHDDATPYPTTPPPTTSPTVAPTTLAAAPIQSIIDAAKQSIINVLQTNAASIPTLGAKFVRLGFHDCVGGCDGCVDMNDDDNAGLLVPINELAPVVTQFDGMLSRADVWAMAAAIGAEQAQPAGNFKTFPLDYYGRVDCSEDANEATGGPARQLPSANLDTHGLLTYFNTEFGFDTRETVVIMGAHTLGTLSASNSGFPGDNGWVGNELRLDNDYYNLLVGGSSATDTLDNLAQAPNWGRSEANGLHFWTRQLGSTSEEVLMVNADIALVRDFEADKVLDTSGNWDGEVDCRFRGGARTMCPLAVDTLSIMAEYKFDNDMWVNDFIDTFELMLIHGYEFNLCGSPPCELTPTVEMCLSFASTVPGCQTVLNNWF